LGIGKSSEVPKAIRKAIECAKKDMITFKLMGTTIAHPIIGVFGASKVFMQPAKKGTGVIAGGAARSVLELAGVKDIVAKSKGSNNAINISLAVINGLKNLMDAETVELERGIKLILRKVDDEVLVKENAHG